MKNKVAVINAYITTDKIIQNNHFPDQGRYHNVYGIDLYSSCDKVICYILESFTNIWLNIFLYVYYLYTILKLHFFLFTLIIL